MLRGIEKIIVFLVLNVFLAYGIVTISCNRTMETKNEFSDIEWKLQEHCIRLLSEEVSSDYDFEMLKVQAIIVRTTVYKQIEEKGKEIIENIDVDFKIDEQWKNKLEQAWHETEGQVIMYKENLALVPFHQVSNGKTRNGEEVLGSKEYPYLQSVECIEDVAAPNQISNVFIPVTGIFIETWDLAGYVTSVTCNDKEISGEEFRNRYNLVSSCFEVQVFEGQTRILTKGVGHGLGLSQYTANKMAKDGKSADEILQFFFPGTEIKEVAEILWEIE